MSGDFFTRRRWRRGFDSREPYRSRPTFDVEQLELHLEPRSDDAPPASALENLRRVLSVSQLPQREFATWVLGCAHFTLTRYLRGEKIPEDRRAFLSRLEGVSLHGDYVVVLVRAGYVRRLPWPPRARAT